MVEGVAEIKIARRVKCDAAGVADFSRRGRAAVASIIGFACADDCGDDLAVRRYFSDPIVERVGDVEIAALVERQSVGAGEQGITKRASVPGESLVELPACGGDEIFGVITNRRCRAPNVTVEILRGNSEVGYAARGQQIQIPTPGHGAASDRDEAGEAIRAAIRPPRDLFDADVVLSASDYGQKPASDAGP